MKMNADARSPEPMAIVSVPTGRGCRCAAGTPPRQPGGCPARWRGWLSYPTRRGLRSARVPPTSETMEPRSKASAGPVQWIGASGRAFIGPTMPVGMEPSPEMQSKQGGAGGKLPFAAASGNCEGVTGLTATVESRPMQVEPVRLEKREWIDRSGDAIWRSFRRSVAQRREEGRQAVRRDEAAWKSRHARTNACATRAACSADRSAPTGR